MPKIIDAVFVGDSHGIIMQTAAETADIRFSHPITAASAMFAGSSLSTDDTGKVEFQIDQLRLTRQEIDEKKAKHRQTKAKKITNSFRAAFDSGLPVYANIGMTARTFVSGVAHAAKANKEDISLISKKLARLSAKSFFTEYAAFYKELRERSPSVTVVFGPTRFVEQNKTLWLAYDEMVVKTMEELDIEVLDLRAELGDENMLLRSEYYKEPDDQVHGNDVWGLAVIDKIIAHHSAR